MLRLLKATGVDYAGRAVSRRANSSRKADVGNVAGVRSKGTLARKSDRVAAPDTAGRKVYIPAHEVLRWTGERYQRVRASSEAHAS